MALTRLVAAGIVAVWAGSLAAAAAQTDARAHAEAAYQRGLRLDLGDAARRDAAGAFLAYREAAEAGLPAAQFNVAVMLDSGEGVARDRVAAARWYARAAVHGHERAAYNLGQLYATGDGVPNNADAAASWFRVASSLPAATRRLDALRGAAPDGTPLVAPSGLHPSDGETLRSSAPASKVELVWTAPRQPAGVRYFVQLVAIVPDRRPVEMRPIFDASLDRTAVLADTADAIGPFAWRVYAVDAASGHYAASAWARFRFGPAANAE